MGDDLARLFLLLIVGALFVNLSRGTARQWLHNKFVGGR
jgi:hypothetical protein